MSNIEVVSLTQHIVLNPANSSVSVINVGPQGPPGVQGVPGPSDASAVLTVNGQLLTRAAGLLSAITRANLAVDAAFTSVYPSVVVHGATSGTARSGTAPILWIGSVNPTNVTNNDLLYRTDTTALYIRISAAWVVIGTFKSAGAPSGTGNDGDWYYDTTNKRAYRSDGVGWIIMSEPDQTYTPTTTGVTRGTAGSVSGTYKRSDGWCDLSIIDTLGTTAGSLGTGPTWQLPMAFFASGLRIIGHALFDDASASPLHGVVLVQGTDKIEARSAVGTNGAMIQWSATVPAAVGVNDVIRIQIRFRMSSRYA